MEKNSRPARFGTAALVSAGFAVVVIGSAIRFTSASTASPQDVTTRCRAKIPCMNVSNRGAGTGLIATSAAGVGIGGVTNNKSTKDSYGTNGVEGVDAATDGGQQNIGVLGVSVTSNGVEGVTNNPSLTSPFGRAAVFGIDGSTDGGSRNWGTAGYSKNGTGILGLSFAAPQASGGQFASALLAVCGNGGSSIEGADGPLPSANLFLLADCSGNLTLEGTVTTGTPPLVVTKRTVGPAVGAYVPRETEPTIEDFGEARLASGRADVALGRDFATTIAQDASYLVFITPEGDSHGLYVTEKTSRGFAVRESQGGRSTMAFSYRVVSRPLGALQARLPRLAASAVGKSAGLAHRSASGLDIARQIGAFGSSPR
jgi:hypothetical protein